MAEPLLLTSVPLVGPQLVLLQEVRRRGGKMSWRWDNPNVQKLAYDFAADLCHRQILRYIEEVSDARQASGTTYVQLTDLGNRLLDSYERQRSQGSVLVAATPGGSPDPSPPPLPGPDVSSAR